MKITDIGIVTDTIQSLRAARAMKDCLTKDRHVFRLQAISRIVGDAAEIIIDLTREKGAVANFVDGYIQELEDELTRLGVDVQKR